MYDKYLDRTIEVNGSVFLFKTDHKMEYNVNFKIKLDNNNLNKYTIKHRDLVALFNIIKEFGKPKSVTIYKYFKTVIKIQFKNTNINFII